MTSLSYLQGLDHAERDLRRGGLGIEHKSVPGLGQDVHVGYLGRAHLHAKVEHLVPGAEHSEAKFALERYLVVLLHRTARDRGTLGFRVRVGLLLGIGTCGALFGCLVHRHDKRVVVPEELRERNNYGVLTGLTKVEAKEQHPIDYEKISNDKTYHDVSNSESYEQITKRATAVFAKIMVKDYKNIAIISHGGVISTYLREVLSIGKNMKLGDCAIVEIVKDASSFKLKFDLYPLLIFIYSLSISIISL